MSMDRDYKIKNDPLNAWANWDEARRDFFRALHADHNSYAQIARAMNTRFGMSLTRNAVCGTVHRRGMAVPIGLKPKAQRPGHKRRSIPAEGAATHRDNARSATIPANLRRKAEQREELGIEDVSPEERMGARLLDLPIWKAAGILGTRSIDQLVDASCRWPLVTDEGATVFCPNDKGRGSYCLAHGGIAYREPHERR